RARARLQDRRCEDQEGRARQARDDWRRLWAAAGAGPRENRARRPAWLRERGESARAIRLSRDGSMKPQTVIAVDVGGTFTDLVLFDGATGRFTTAKTPSQRGDETEGFLTGLQGPA